MHAGSVGVLGYLNDGNWPRSICESITLHRYAFEIEGAMTTLFLLLISNRGRLSLNSTFQRSLDQLWH